MKSITLEDQGKLQAAPLDEATKAAVEIGRAQLQRGEGIPAEIVKMNVRNRIHANRRAAPSPLTGG